MRVNVYSRFNNCIPTQMVISLGPQFSHCRRKYKIQIWKLKFFLFKTRPILIQKWMLLIITCESIWKSAIRRSFHCEIPLKRLLLVRSWQNLKLILHILDSVFFSIKAVGLYRGGAFDLSFSLKGRVFYLLLNIDPEILNESQHLSKYLPVASSVDFSLFHWAWAE